MSHIVYSDTPEHLPGVPPKYEEMPANRIHLRHFSNLLYLRFIHDNTKDGAEKRQANHEIGIANRKMAYWEKHPNFSIAQFAEESEKEKAKWAKK